jgi:hypothetical protein
MIAFSAPLLVYLLATFSQYLAYLNIPTRHLTPWDQTLHIKDGYAFYLQLSQGDILSFLYSFISLNFWLPLHPLLVALTTLFTGFSPDAYVALNFLFVGTGLGFSTLIFYQTSKNAIRTLLFGMTSLALTLLISQSVHFYETHLNVMLESLGYGLTLVFGTSFLLELTGPHPNQKQLELSSTLTLSLQLFTKIQYGLFFGATYILFHLWMNRNTLISKDGWLRELLKTLKIRKGFLVFLTVLNLFGVFALVTRNRFSHLGFGVPDGLWAHGFTLVLIASWLWRSKAPDAITIKSKIPESILKIGSIILIPFGWYYLFPLRNKIRWLLYNSGSGEALSMADALSIIPKQICLFFGAPEQFWPLAILIMVGALGILSITRRSRLPLIFGLACILALYFPLSVFAIAHFPRFITTLLALLIAFLAVSISSIIKNRIANGLLTALVGLYCLNLAGQTNTAVMGEHLKQNIFFQPEYESIELALATFDFKADGLIYGLGQSMDQSVPLYELAVLRANPRNASHLPLDGKRRIITHNLGRSGNENPVPVIGELLKAPAMMQAMLFRKGFQEQPLATLIQNLTNQEYGFKVAKENNHFIFLKR